MFLSLTSIGDSRAFVVIGICTSVGIRNRCFIDMRSLPLSFGIAEFIITDSDIFCFEDKVEAFARRQGISAALYDELKKCQATYKLLLCDACRNDPFKQDFLAATPSASRPTTPVPEGTTVALFSCEAGEKAFEDDRFQHGVFFHYVIQGLKGDADKKSVPADLMGDKEALDLVRSYYAIPENQRRRLFELARVLSDVA